MHRFAPYLLALFVLLVLPMQVQALVSACCYGDSGSDRSATHDCCPSNDMAEHDADDMNGCHCQDGQASSSIPLVVDDSPHFAALVFNPLLIPTRGDALPDPLLRPPRSL